MSTEIRINEKKVTRRFPLWEITAVLGVCILILNIFAVTEISWFLVVFLMFWPILTVVGILLIILALVAFVLVILGIVVLFSVIAEVIRK